MRPESTKAFKVRLQSKNEILDKSEQDQDPLEYSKLDCNPETGSWFDKSKARVSQGTQN